jgi:hypothetical protein
VHAFGLPFNTPLLASLEQLCAATTVPELDHVLQSPKFHEKMVAIGEIEIDDGAVRDNVKPTLLDFNQIGTKRSDDNKKLYR